MKAVRLRLYIGGESPRAIRAASNLRRLCNQLLGDDWELEVIDVVDRPDLAEDARIFATPTVVKLTPAPIRRAIGDLSDIQRLAAALDLGVPSDEEISNL
ncbi:circadian clock KaiB family protein [Euzebya rosea]|uniref:circadian clock KaiB family protein n=1 Tax=Euzebya rosea TaxID=2052804 RepID=UPI000D3E04AE|nr:circadian clock KaiB family protein [Euzebya rosea]